MAGFDAKVGSEAKRKRRAPAQGSMRDARMRLSQPVKCT
jgi:hypothetical protein